MEGIWTELEREGLPVKEIREIWEEEETSDVYFLGDVVVLDLGLRERFLIVGKGKEVYVVAEGGVKREEGGMERALEIVAEELDRVWEELKEVQGKVKRYWKGGLDWEEVRDLNEEMFRLLELKRELSYFSKVFVRLKGKAKNWEEVYHDLLEVLSLAESTIDSIKATLDAYDSLFSRELNILIKRLTSFSIILMLLSIITGIYGMNFWYLPLASHPHGFWIMVGVMSGLFLLLLALFKKIGYL